MTPVIIVFIAEKKQSAKLPSVSDDYENEVEFLSKQLEDLSVHQSSEQSHSSVAQNENHFAGTISDISNDESLQDIIDSILPSNSNDHSSHGLEKLSPSAKVKDVKRKFSAAAIGSQRSDDDDDDDVFSDDDDGGVGDDNKDDDHNNEDIHWDFKPLQKEVLGYILDHEKEPEISEDSQKGVEAIPDLKHVLECIDADDYYNYDSHNMNTNNDKPVEWPLTSLERKKLELKPINCTESLSVVKSSDNKGYGKNPTCNQMQNEKLSKAKLSDADLIEIFGSSDEEGDDKSFVMKQSSCSTKLKGGTKTCVARFGDIISRNELHDVFDSPEKGKFLQTPLQYAKMGFPCDTDCTNALAENGQKIITSTKGCLSSILQDVSCAKSNVSSSIEDSNFEKGVKRNKEELPKATRKVLEPANTILNNVFQPSMQGFDSQKNENCGSVDDIFHQESSRKFQEYESWKENTDSPCDDYMPAPLSKRLGKQFSAKRRLASLHSISSVSGDS